MDSNTLHKLLKVDYNKGRLFYLPRTIEMFSHCKQPLKALNTFNSRYAGEEAFTLVDDYDYLYGRLFQKGYKAHRVIFCMYHGYWPDEVDHWDRNRRHNSISNLREVTSLENSKNMGLRKTNIVGVSGVTFSKRHNKWRARIGLHGKSIELGFYAEMKDAIAARMVANKEYGFKV